jgi:lipocalin
MKQMITILGLAIVVFSCAGAAKNESPLTVVDTVNLDRYLGKWYEIASNPSWFQKGCTGSTAEYSLLSDGKIQVVNRCYKDRLEGPLKESKGKAEVVAIPLQMPSSRSGFSGPSKAITGLSILTRIINGLWWGNPHGNIYGFSAARPPWTRQSIRRF